MRKIIATLVIFQFTFFCVLNDAEARQIKVKDGTVVPVEALETVRTNTTSVGRTIRFKVTKNVKRKGVIVIKKGAIARGKVVRAKRAQMGGIPGELYIELERVEARNDESLRISGSFNSRGSDEMASTIGIGLIICPFVLLNKGGDSTMHEGTEIRAIVDGNQIIDLRD